MTVEARLRESIEAGRWDPQLFAPGAVMRTSNEHGRERIDGRDAVVAHLSGPGPGDVSVWDCRGWETGLALTFECDTAAGPDRRRWYVRLDEGEMVEELWSAAARPQAAAERFEPPADLLRELGADAVEPLVHGGNSGAALLRVRAGDEIFILKRVTAGSDWLARATGDDGRTARLQAAGAFAEMPGVIENGVVTASREDGAAWIAMRDISAHLLGDDRRLSRAESATILRAAAALHAHFRGRVPDGAATLEARLGLTSPANSERERAGTDLMPKQFELGWEAFSEVVDDDIAEPVLAAVGNPAPLAAALTGAYGAATLIHGDLRDDNLGLDGDRLVLIDWDIATAGTPTVEFAWYLAQDAWRIDATHDEIEADHRAAQGEAVNDTEAHLGMVSGLVQYGWLLAHSARVHPDPVETAWGRAELAWWVPRVRQALAAGAL